MLFSTAFQLHIAKTDSESFMVCARLSEHSIVNILNYWDSIKNQYPEAKDIITKKEAHATLRYWKKAEYNETGKVASALSNLPYPNEIHCNIVGLEIFGGEDRALVIRIESPELSAVQKNVDQALQGLGIAPSKYPEFKGHVTLCYNVDKVPKDNPDFNLVINKIEFVDNKDKAYYKKELEKSKEDVKIENEGAKNED